MQLCALIMYRTILNKPAANVTAEKQHRGKHIMYVTAVRPIAGGHFQMEAEVLSQSHVCRQQQQDNDVDGRRQPQKTTSASITFSKELISFSLYGKIRQNSKRPWNEALSSKIAEVQDSFKNIPPTLYFSPSSVAYDGIGVYVAETLPKGTLLGPYYGKAVKKEYADEETHEWLWEVYQESSLAYFIDASDPKYGNWMNFIQCARNQDEQNLKALQYNGYLYFESVHEVTVGEELLVWYDDLQYDIYMGIPVGHKGKIEVPTTESSQSPSVTESYPSSRPPSGNSDDLFMSSGTPTSAAAQSGSSASDTSIASTEDSGISITFEHGGLGMGAGGSKLRAGGCGERGTASMSGVLPLGTFPPSTETGIATPMYQTTTTNTSSHSEVLGSSSCLAMNQIPRGVDQLTTQQQQQQSTLQLPIFVPGENFKMADRKTVTVERPKFTFDSVSSIPTSTAAVTGVDVNSPTWTSSNTTSPYNVVTPGHHVIYTHAKPIPPPLGCGGLTTRWVPTTNTLTDAIIGGVGEGGGEGRGKHCNLLYGMFRKTEDGTRWQCVECKRLFSSQGSLRAHARIHTGERPYQCQYCLRTFCQASTLRSHERLHTGEKPYKCEHCGRAFTQSAGLRSHLKTHRYDS